MEPQTSSKAISIQKLLGVNERAQFGNSELGEFDQLTGFFSPNTGSLKQVPGKKFQQYIDSNQILQIYPTYDSRKNIIIQTTASVLIISEDDFFNRPLVSILVPVPTLEEEDMSQALLAHVVAGVNVGAGGTTLNVYVDRPINQLISQYNPDGTAATFLTLNAGTGVISLTTGWYRIRGWCLASDNAAGTKVVSQVLNATSGLPLWLGLQNQESSVVGTTAANDNMRMDFDGVFHAAVPTDIKVQTKMFLNTKANTGLGAPKAPAGAKDIYLWIEILRTGS